MKFILKCWFFACLLVVASCKKETSEIVIVKKEVENIEIDTTWKQLSLREKIGQIVCLKYSKNQIDAFGENGMEKFLERYPVGSVFLASWEMKNIASGEKLEQAYRNTANKLAMHSKYPLLISEDFEQGLGNLIPQYTSLTTEMGIGATGSSKYASWYGNIIASESRSIGVNWLLHPVADLNKNPFNFLTNTRATGDSEELAIKLLPAQIEAMQYKNVAATAKHFPGDGTDYINQHFATSTMKLSFEEWQKQHGAVFQNLINNGVMAIMPGHITFPDYQKEKYNGEYLPATLSKELMVNLLKEEMGFKGVIVSDALNMAGISGYYKGQLETEIESFKAGADILLWPQIEIIDSIEAKIIRKEIPLSRLNDAVRRVWNLKKKLGVLEKDYNIVQPISNEKLVENKNKAKEISEKSITLISNKNKVIPFDTVAVKSILMVIVSDEDKLETFNPLKNEFERRGYNVSIQNDLSFFENGNKMEEISKKYDRIIFNFYATPNNPWGSLSLKGKEALTMWSANYLPFEKVITIGFGDPYRNMIYLPRIWCRINCYNSDAFSQIAIAKGLTGEIEFSGLSPVKNP